MSQPPSGPPDGQAVTVPAGGPGDFRRGLRLGLPILLGYTPVGIAFGVLAVAAGFSVLQTVTCSATALAGAGQFIALSLVAGGAPVTSALLATAVVNLRYVLFASTMSTHLAGHPLARQALLAFTLTDETFAVNVADRRQGRSTVASMAGVGAVAWLGWVAGTAIGAVGGGFLGDPQRWGAGFAMPAMFTALFVALAQDRRHVLIGAVAGAISLLLPIADRLGAVVGASWHVVIAATAAAAIGAVVFRD